MKPKLKKKSLVGWTNKDWDLVWTFANTVNVTCVIQKTPSEAMARYDDMIGHKNIKKIRITIEEIE